MDSVAPFYVLGHCGGGDIYAIAIQKLLFAPPAVDSWKSSRGNPLALWRFGRLPGSGYSVIKATITASLDVVLDVGEYPIISSNGN